MSKKIKALIAVGGTGGHVFPGCNLAKHFTEQNYEVILTTDKRGSKFLNKFSNLNIYKLPSSPLNKKNIFKLIFSSIFIIYSILRSVVFLLTYRPSIVFGMGGYASFPICIAAKFLTIKFVIYENNLVIGKANKILLPFAEKIIVSYKELEGISEQYHHKIFQTGNIIKKEIINFEKNKILEKKINLLVLGGSQAAKIFAEKLPNIFEKCKTSGFQIKIYQHCMPAQNDKLKEFYKKANIDFEIFNFSDNLIEYFSKTNLAITRSGSSMLAELTNANIPFISIPLPSSADNHQLKNAEYYQRKNFAFMVQEKDLNIKLFNLIKEIYENNEILEEIIINQRQHSDKNVYNNIDLILKEIINEKN
tara:strand:- start:15526 stop:16614 length:1089 start_codon:yes stop_codon:yes gene_type:complete